MIGFRTLKPLLNRVVIQKVVKQSKTKGGIILNTGKEETLNYGKVIAVGPGKVLDNGSVRECMVKEGETVLLPEYGGSKVVLANEEELFIYRDDDIMGTLHEPTE